MELSRGVFRRADASLASYPDLLAVAYRAPRAIVCCVSAAAVYDLTDELPRAVHIAVPTRDRPPRISYPATEVFRFGPNTFELGLSSLDDKDASQNETGKLRGFERDRWYRIRIRVTKERITAWIDKEQVVDVSTKGRKISIRPECDLCRPFGIATWRTVGAVRNIGLFGMIDVVRSRSPYEPMAPYNGTSDEMKAIAAHFRKNGLYTMLGSSVRV